MTSQPAANITSAPAPQQAALLRRLHVPGDPLVLPNAWDAASAAMVAEAGFPVIATSSPATAAVLGYPDGRRRRSRRSSRRRPGSSRPSASR